MSLVKKLLTILLYYAIKYLVSFKADPKGQRFLWPPSVVIVVLRKGIYGQDMLC